MSMGYSEHVGARVTVFRLYGEPLTFGMGSEYGEVLSLSWGRQLGQGSRGLAGRLVFVLSGRAGGQVGTAWSEVISPRDYIEVEVNVSRSQAADPLGWGSTDGWETRFTGFVNEITAPTLTPDGEQLTTVVCSDQMGVLAQQHYAYWRNVGAVFRGNLPNEGIIATLGALAEKGHDRFDLEANSIAGAADTLFKVLLYDRLGFSRDIGGTAYRWDDLHGYLFQSDDFGIHVDVTTLAPEGKSWADAVSWVLDAPFFHEFFMENLTEAEAERTLRNGGVRDVGRVSQVRRKAAKRKLKGGRQETFVLRPSPFPTYDPQRGGYNGAAWDGLPIVESLPTGNTSHDLRRSDADLYSLYSVDLVNQQGTQVDRSGEANAEAQVIGDAEAYNRRVGYSALDPTSKRAEVRYQGGGQVYGQSLDRAELARRLAWQVFSWSQFNDRFYAGTITGPLDLRAQLGVKYLDEGRLYYVEGYQHTIGADGSAGTEWTVSRGLSAAAYGVTKAAHPHNLHGRTGQTDQTEAEQGLYAAYLGRQRPGEKYAPVIGNATSGIGQEHGR